VLRLFGDFYDQMTNPKYSAVTDVYAVMFVCDLITFLIVVFGYASFGPSVSSFSFMLCLYDVVLAYLYLERNPSSQYFMHGCYL